MCKLIFGSDVAERVHYKKLISYPTSPDNNVSALPLET